MKIKYILQVACLVSLLFSCKKDDDNGTTVVPPRDMAEVATENNDSIVSFLKTHFYNYEEFAAPATDFNNEIVIDTIAGDNAGKTPLFDQVTSKVIKIKNSDGVEVAHTLYYLVAKEGIGVHPTVADSTLVEYKGRLLDGTLFDSSSTTWFSLLSVVRGFSEFMPILKSGGEAVDNGDGTFTFTDYGVGLVIMPSGLAYFNETTTTISAYSPLIFSVKLFDVNEADHDGDGILSIDEDVDGDGNPRNDNTDNDTYINAFDPDDDGDGILTKNEYDVNGDGIPDDTDGDGIPDYLDNK